MKNTNPGGQTGNPVIYGTSHFVNKDAAIRYYKDYEGSYADAKRAVESKLAEGSIHIGPPTRLKPGAKVTVIRGEGRYQVTENPGGSSMGAYYTIKASDVGKPSITAFGRRWHVADFIGHIGAYDVGKRVYRRGDILQAENDQQMKRRLGQSSNPSRRGSSFTKAAAMEAAKSNAAYFGRPYVVYTDTSGNWRSTAVVRDTHVAYALVYPDGRVVSSSAETTVGELKRRSQASNPAVSLAAIDKALRKAGKTVQVKLTGAAAATLKKAMSLTPAGRRKARSEAIVRRVMGNPARESIQVWVDQTDPKRRFIVSRGSEGDAPDTLSVHVSRSAALAAARRAAKKYGLPVMDETYIDEGSL